MRQRVASCSMLIVNLHDHREIIVGGFDWDRKVKAEERRATPETWPSRATGPEELSGRAPRWMVLTAALTLEVGIGVYWLNRRQTEREHQAEAERERERQAL